MVSIRQIHWTVLSTGWGDLPLSLLPVRGKYPPRLNWTTSLQGWYICTGLVLPWTPQEASGTLGVPGVHRGINKEFTPILSPLCHKSLCFKCFFELATTSKAVFKAEGLLFYLCHMKTKDSAPSFLRHCYGSLIYNMTNPGSFLQPH